MNKYINNFNIFINEEESSSTPEVWSVINLPELKNPDKNTIRKLEYLRKEFDHKLNDDPYLREMMDNFHKIRNWNFPLSKMGTHDKLDIDMMRYLNNFARFIKQIEENLQSLKDEYDKLELTHEEKFDDVYDKRRKTNEL